MNVILHWNECLTDQGFFKQFWNILQINDALCQTSGKKI